MRKNEGIIDLMAAIFHFRTMQSILSRHWSLVGRIILTFLLTTGLLFVESSLLGKKLAWAGDKKELVVLMVGGSWGNLIKEYIGKPFEERYGIKVVYDIRPNTEQLIALQASKNNPFADAIEVGMGRVARGTMMGLYAKQDAVKVPNRKFVPKQFKTDYWTGRGFSPIVLVYNKAKVDEKDCTSWDILTNPKYRGRVGLMKFGWNGEQFLHAINKIKGGTYQDTTPGIKFCRKVIENEGTILISNDQIMSLFESGELWIASYYPGRAEQLIKKGIPLAYKYVPGSIAYTWGFAVVNNAKNIDLAYKWVDMAIGIEPAIQYAVKLGYAPTNSKTVLPTNVSRAALMSKEDLANVGDLDLVEIAKTTHKNLERWNVEVLK